MGEVRKISVSMPPEVLDRVRAAAVATGESVSGWLTAAAERQLQEQSRLQIGRIAADRLLAEYEQEFGPVPQRILDDVDAFLDGPGPTPEPGLRDVG